MQREFFTILHELNKNGTTIFMSSHILSEIQRSCNRAAIIREGQIIACASVDALAKTNIEELEQKFEDAVDDLVKKSSMSKDLIIKQSFFTPSCGAGGLSMELAQKAMSLVNELSDKLKKKYGLIL